ncbi:MAG: YceD family protein [Betaproteobacteria bacterium]
MSRQLIDGVEFAAAGATQQGVLPLSSFPRLRDLLATDAGTAAYALEGLRDARGRPGLSVKVQATLQLRCQRCLEPLPLEVDPDSLLVLAASQAEIDAEPESVDAPDRVVAGHEMPVADLVEDELILAVPYAPRHDDCKAAEAARDEAKASPFAGLKGLVKAAKQNGSNKH